jgi:type II secretory pathway pseudopilin PulG
MKKVFKTMLGVTLLEVMLVLAIAAMIIVMSVRYYQSANSSQQANSILQQVQGIVSAANTLAQAQGSYSSVSIGSAALKPLLPGGWDKTPWGETIIVDNPSATTFDIDIGNVPSGVCPLLLTKLATDNHFSIGGTPPVDVTACGDGSAAAAIKLTYTSNP